MSDFIAGLGVFSSVAISFLGAGCSIVVLAGWGSSFFGSITGCGFACGGMLGRAIGVGCVCAAGATFGCSALVELTLVFFFVCCLIATKLIQREGVCYCFLYNFHQIFVQWSMH